MLTARAPSRRVWLSLLFWILVPGPLAGQELPFDPTVKPRPATPEDILVLAPFIGTFRSPSRSSDRFPEPVYHLATYKWVDEERTSVEFRIETRGAETEEPHSFVTGYYGHESVGQQLFAVAVFSSGGAGLARVGEFDVESGFRVVHATLRGPDNELVHIRDVFEVIDDSSWRDRTYVRVGQNGSWSLVYEEVFTRID